MFSLFRNSFFRVLKRDWPWVSLVVVALLCSVDRRGEQLLSRAALVAGTATAFVAGVACFGFAHSALAAAQLALRRQQRQFQFLCGDCLRRGRFRYACGKCKKPLDGAIAHLRGAYINECPDCSETLFECDGRKGVGVKARCEHCNALFDETVFHHRKVRVVGIFEPQLVEALAQRDGRTLGYRRFASHCAWIDDGERLTFFIRLDNLESRSRREWKRHALRQLEVIWVGENAGTPPELAARFGALLRLGVQAKRWRAMRVLMEDPAPHAAVVNHLVACGFQTPEAGWTLESVYDGRVEASPAPIPEPQTLRAVTDAVAGEAALRGLR